MAALGRDSDAGDLVRNRMRAPSKAASTADIEAIDRGSGRARCVPDGAVSRRASRSLARNGKADWHAEWLVSLRTETTS